MVVASSLLQEATMSKVVLYVAAALGMLALGMMLNHHTAPLGRADAGMTHAVAIQAEAGGGGGLA
jgi:hypothetical protein